MTSLQSPPIADPLWMDTAGLSDFIRTLQTLGYTVVGPTIDQGAIIYGVIDSVEQLPRGWTDRQEAASYRLERRDDSRYFGFVVGPHSWKQFLFPPSEVVSIAERTANGWEVQAAAKAHPRYAFLGVRACELAAIGVQDRVFLRPGATDPNYAARRAETLLIAVNCTQAATTCFCHAMRTGPRCGGGFDLALTELDTGFVVEVGTRRGEEIVAGMSLRAASPTELAWAEKGRQTAIDQQTRTLPVDDARDLLLRNLNHPRWDHVAERCLSCANCTMVCPTCFCASVQEVTDLDITRVERERVWDSCFNADFSYMNGGVVRHSIRSRYRQWLTHKLATWFDQFGTSGCVGCGRCITWCPVGIDLTEEVAAFQRRAP